MRLEKCAAEHWLWARPLPSPWLGSLQEGFSWELKAQTHCTEPAPREASAGQACHGLSTTAF